MLERLDHSVIIHGDAHGCTEVEATLLHLMRDHRYPEDDVVAVRIAFREAVVNAIRHGHEGDEGKRLRIAYTVDDEQVVIHIEDQGGGFVPETVPDPRGPDARERPGGRGLTIMRHYMDAVIFNETGNVIELIRKRTAVQSPGARQQSQDAAEPHSP